MRNQSILNDFFLYGLSDLPVLRLPLFLIFLLIYLLTLLWNLLTIVLIVTDSHLHVPMYFFVGNLANLIESFFCDLPQLFHISCSDIFINILLVFLVGGFLAGGALTLTILSYVYIFKTVLKMQAKGNRSKVFSTCNSHLTLLFMNYGSSMFNYFWQSAGHHFYGEKGVAIFYTVILPFLNPLIYSLRNRDFRTAFQRVFRRIFPPK
ncbi:hypothetical protein AB205_0072740 [Aquarana catesbeiana]|uniref:G-protein coupled receptors family 1 profile domain-containing protein n=1 Tax=Aquarana catesbeiana TaxID=8400 RepID=A0A2G9Q7S6_AQUCT|nr:hypothetical protein AB205_0072740 [Aquarana catesbeiana]